MSAAIDLSNPSIPEQASVEREAFISAMRGAVTGVSVVASDGPMGRFGLTVSAFSSVSADPPTVLVCIRQESPLRVAIMGNGSFSVNVLSAAQRELADQFAGLSRDTRPYEFEPSSWNEGATGAPLLAGATASFDCMLDQAIPSGSHAIFIGRVIAVTGRSAAPLLYNNRTYGRPASLGARPPNQETRT